MQEGEKSKIIEGGEGEQIEKEKIRPLRIVFDFDETLAGTDGSAPDKLKVPEIRPEAEELLEKLKAEGHTLILWTTAGKEWVEPILTKSSVFPNTFSEIYTIDNPPELEKAKIDEIDRRIQEAKNKSEETQDDEDYEKLDRLEVLKNLMLEHNKVPSSIGADVLVDNYPYWQKEAGENVIEVPGYRPERRCLKRELLQALENVELDRKRRGDIDDIKEELEVLEEESRSDEERCKGWEKSVLEAVHKLALKKADSDKDI